MITVSITIKDDSQTLKEDFIIHDPLVLDCEDKNLKEMIQSVKEKFKGQPEEVIIKARMDI